MGKIVAIAYNTFRESIRDKILTGVLLFVALIIISSVATVQLTVGQWMRLTTDVGLGSISLFGVLLAVFLGISLVFKEIDRKTVYTIVSKPVRRSQFLAGKYIGLLLTIVVNAALMLLVLLATLAYVSRQEQNPYLGIFQAWLLMLSEFMLVTAVAVFFSTFSSPVLSAMFSIGIWIIGHLLSDIRFWGEKSMSEAVRIATDVIYYVMPNLELLNVRSRVTYHIPIGWDYVGWTSAYAMAYTLMILVAAAFIFSRRDFK
ncbi:MAG: ABC transporter permease subunit [Deltaproteobacteria bacterium]|nr:ABC transporter permease subunit [Deltaproteobacteria bacterium]